MDNGNFLILENLKKYFPLRRGFFKRLKGYVYAVDGVNLVIKKGETIPIPGWGKTYLGCIAGSIVGWFVSYPFGPIFWVLLPPFFAAGVGAAIHFWGQYRPLLANIIAMVSVGLSAMVLVFLLGQYRDQPDLSFKTSILTKTKEDELAFVPQDRHDLYGSTHVWVTQKDNEIGIKKTRNRSRVQARAEDGLEVAVPTVSAWTFPYSSRRDTLFETPSERLGHQASSWGYHWVHSWQGYQIFYRIKSIEKQTVLFEVRIVKDEENAVFDGILSVPVGEARDFLPEGSQIGLRIRIMRIMGL